MLRIPPELLCDFYKLAHRPEYPKNTQEVLSTWTARSSRTGETKVMFFGMQGFIEGMLIDYFNENFFERPREEVVAEYVRFVRYTLGDPNPESAHIAALWDLGYLPIEIRALPEGARVPLRVPVATFVNTLPDFFWLTNALETLISVGNWISTTSATTAFRYRVILEKWTKITGADPAGVLFQAHDFSMRGMAGLDAAIMSGAAHLTSFVGTDTCPAIFYHEAYYGANIETELVGTSIPASEHSVMSAGGLGEGEELATYRRLLTEVHPSGFVSIVSDTVDLYRVIDGYLPILKDIIMTRDGRLVIRPDSGDPADIICGTMRELGGDDSEAKGVIERLWEIFGGSVNEAGYKVLDSHIGAIYGDSITTARVEDILERLAHKGFASSNIVFGVGSYCVGRDTPVLCADLIWRPAGELVAGQEILAFDEDPDYTERAGNVSRRFKTAHIVSNSPALKKCFKVFTDVGDPIIASAEHPWLVWTKKRSRENAYYGEVPEGIDPHNASLRQRGLVWKNTNELELGDKIAFFGKPWTQEDTFNAGWVSGMFDGEGSLSRSTGDFRLPAWKVNISQNRGPILDRLRLELLERGFGFYENVRECPQLVLTGGWREVLRFLGTFRPERLLKKLPEILSSPPALKRKSTYEIAHIVGIEDTGRSPVASIETSCGTFITGGYLTHNTYQGVTRDSYGWAMKAVNVIIDGVDRAIFKDPKTDKDHSKKSAKGRVKVLRIDNEYVLFDGCTPEEVEAPENMLVPIFRDGVLLESTTLAEIRARVDNEVKIELGAAA
jgi:nicotinamide phosphoribosyltransferase